MDSEFSFHIKRFAFDERYRPAANTRLTTNFANLARGENREQNLRNTFTMLNERFNQLADWDNPKGNRYRLELEIISVEMTFNTADGLINQQHLPLIEMLNTGIIDTHTAQRHEGIVGNNFSSYVRDYDFSIRLPAYNQAHSEFRIPDGFGDLHAALYQKFIHSAAYAQHFAQSPVICLSISTTKTYHRTTNRHPILGVEYRQNDYSLTDDYFKKMGLQVRYFMPAGSRAPLAFYFSGDLLNDYSNLQLIATISTMETFQKIYRPEIYNANSVAGDIYQPSLAHQDYSLTQIVYDRDERSRLAIEQGKAAEQLLIQPFQSKLSEWLNRA